MRTQSLENWYRESDTAKLTSADLDALDEFVVKQAFNTGFEAAKRKAISLVIQQWPSLMYMIDPEIVDQEKVARVHVELIAESISNIKEE